MTLTLLKGEFVVCRLDSLPAVEPEGQFWSLSVSSAEISLVCEASLAPSEAKVEPGWRAFRVEGPMPFDLVGVVAGITSPLASAQLPVFVVSTFDTDYLLVKLDRLDQAISALKKAGHQMII